MHTSTRIGCTSQQDIEQAVESLFQQIGQPQMSLVLVFCSPVYDLAQLAQGLQQRFLDVPVVGCSTAGEIGPEGYLHDSICAVSFASESFSVSIEPFENLQELALNEWRTKAAKLLNRHHSRFSEAGDQNTFALLLVDGMSMREEPLVRMIASALPGIPLVGGSAGDNLRFEATLLIYQGRLLRDSALLVMISTSLPFRAFKTQHFEACDQRMVVTGAVPEKRIVSEINGRPAAAEYAHILGLDAEKLSPMVFAAHPVVVKMGDAEYVRSIQKVNGDGSLTFFCAIDLGIVLRVVRGVDLVSNLSQSMENLTREIGQPQALLTCDCILRRLEVEQHSLTEPVSALLARYNSVGFSTYGEQFNGVHVNQTCTGIAIGHGDDR